MKKKIIFISIFIIFIATMIYSFFTVEFIKIDKKNMQKEISTLKEEIEKNRKENTDYEEEVNKLKEESKSKLEELEIWKKAQEKLKQAS